METLIFDAKTKTLTLKQTEIPEIKSDNDVLVKVAYAGICGTDLHIIEGEFPCLQERPLALGHEFCGTVAGVGKNVKSVQISDRIVIDPASGCHICDHCHSGNPHFCAEGGLNFYIGMFRDGGWENYCLVPEEQIHKLPDSVTFEQGVLCEPLSCIAHGWDLISPIPVGKKILIIGAGIIGNLFAINFHLQGHRKVTVSEPNLTRLKQLEKLETGFTLITPKELESRQKTDPHYRFDLIVECSGYGPAVEHAITLLNKGGTLGIFGCAPPTTTIRISPFDIFMYEKRIVGMCINPFTLTKAIGLVEAFGSRYLKYENLGIRIFKLSEYKDAIAALKKGDIAKAVFKLS